MALEEGNGAEKDAQPVLGRAVGLEMVALESGTHRRRRSRGGKARPDLGGEKHGWKLGLRLRLRFRRRCGGAEGSVASEEGSLQGRLRRRAETRGAQPCRGQGGEPQGTRRNRRLPYLRGTCRLSPQDGGGDQSGVAVRLPKAGTPVEYGSFWFAPWLIAILVGEFDFCHVAPCWPDRWVSLVRFRVKAPQSRP